MANFCSTGLEIKEKPEVPTPALYKSHSKYQKVFTPKGARGPNVVFGSFEEVTWGLYFVQFYSVFDQCIVLSPVSGNIKLDPIELYLAQYDQSSWPLSNNESLILPRLSTGDRSTSVQNT